MAHAKVSFLQHGSQGLFNAANDAFTPVPARRRRYGRAALWADRAGVPEVDFNRLSAMRAMERKNRG
jgi:hypothetical protein